MRRCFFITFLRPRLHNVDKVLESFPGDDYTVRDCISGEDFADPREKDFGTICESHLVREWFM